MKALRVLLALPFIVIAGQEDSNFLVTASATSVNPREVVAEDPSGTYSAKVKATRSSSSTLSTDTQDAMNAAKEAATSVSIKDLVTENSATASVPEYGADVSDLEALFDKGQGDLLTPGSAKAEGCLDKSSYDCQAVQVIYDTESRPSWPESEFDDVLNGRDSILAQAGNSVSGLESTQEICDTIITTSPALYEYEICEESTGGSSESCYSGWAENLEVSTLFSCVDRTQSLKYVTCTMPYLASIKNYTCIEAPRQSCTMGETVSVTSQYTYRCETQTYTAQTYRCNKVLTLSGVASCEIGKMYEANIQDDTVLGEDPCNGGDSIKLKYECSQDEIPLIEVATNWKDAPDFTFTIQANSFNEEREFSNCKGVWSGTTKCSGSNCITQITMDISYKNGSEFIYSGSLTKVFSFQKLRTDSGVETWTQTCSLSDGYSLEP